MTRNKKAQIIGQVFIFILAALIAVLIIIYGYRAIVSFTQKTEDITLLNFQTGLEREIRKMASEYGSVKRLDLNLPSNYDKFCIVYLDYQNKERTPLCTPNSDNFEPGICDAWTTDGNQDNAFLIPIYPMEVPDVQISEGYLCPTVRGNKISLRLEGLGDRTKVSEWPVEQ